MDWPVLAPVPAEDRRRLVATLRRRAYRRDEVIFHQGDPADEFVGDQDYERKCGGRGQRGDDLERDVAETEPPSREGAAGREYVQ